MRLKNTPKIIWILFAVFALYVFTSRGGYDGYELENYLTAENIFLNQKLSLSSGYSNLPGINLPPDGSEVYARHGLAQPLLEVPLYALGYFSPIKLPQVKIESSVSNIGDLPMTPLVSVSLFNIIVTIAAVFLVYLFVRRLLKDEKTALLSAIFYAFGTIAWPYSAIGLEPLLVFSLFATFYFLFAFEEEQKSGYLTAAGISAAILLNTKSYACVFFLPLTIYALTIFLQKRKWPTRREFLLVLFPLLIGGLLFFYFNWLRFGNFLSFSGGKSSPFASSYVLDNLLALTVSVGKGFFVYSPVTILALFSLTGFYRKFKTTARMIGSIVLALFMVILPIWFARTDEMWGPRYLNVLVPFLVLISSLSLHKMLTSLKGKVVLAVFFLISVWVQLVGLSFFGNRPIEIAFQAGARNIDEIIYIPKVSPIVVGSRLYLSTVCKNLTGKANHYSYNYIPGTSISGASPEESKTIDLEEDSHFITLPFRALGSKSKEITFLFHTVILAGIAGVIVFLFRE